MFEAALREACAQLGRCLDDLGAHSPGDTSVANRFQPSAWPGVPHGTNGSWTAGFWTGLLWMAHELSGEARFAEAARAQLPGYALRLDAHYLLDHHDLGFLYLPSCVAARRSGVDARATALRAADLLMKRYLPRAGVIQAWGQLDDPAQRGRIIIDCLLNLPLLHWASAERGDDSLRDAALSHALRSQQYLVRSDDTSFHTFHFDATTGAPRHGTTQQGASNDSCWARGQAWGVYGFALNHRFAPGLGFLDTAERLARRFLQGLPAHGVACWDLSLADVPGEPWDSSASAIAACGLIEIAQLLRAEGQAERAAFYSAAADRLLTGLLQHCAGWRTAGSNALLLHSVYSKPEALGVDEACLWGDFFFLEALARSARGWAPFWHPGG
ncbi:glycoside hydrolase family 88 protein [Roseateles asaccharophilus]|uniref:Unsaturated chondroitin disaccharide hydrolase n=1 Tax=Roseateles asaccharophilus TaxID=582607 RepID=A0ABU2A3Y4_9BURK|nr:glycoside hydrolase family 88 protein [Roseateles asaccharophilus]MDR7331909.1 unsaturated chondroitin disaccharide hydrolase [Roseateles asaccharophilus]